MNENRTQWSNYFARTARVLFGSTRSWTLRIVFRLALLDPDIMALPRHTFNEHLTVLSANVTMHCSKLWKPPYFARILLHPWQRNWGARISTSSGTAHRALSMPVREHSWNAFPGCERDINTRSGCCLKKHLRLVEGRGGRLHSGMVPERLRCVRE